MTRCSKLNCAYLEHLRTHSWVKPLYSPSEVMGEETKLWRSFLRREIQWRRWSVYGVNRLSWSMFFGIESESMYNNVTSIALHALNHHHVTKVNTLQVEPETTIHYNWPWRVAKSPLRIRLARELGALSLMHRMSLQLIHTSHSSRSVLPCSSAACCITRKSWRMALLDTLTNGFRQSQLRMLVRVS